MSAIREVAPWLVGGAATGYGAAWLGYDLEYVAESIPLASELLGWFGVLAI